MIGGYGHCHKTICGIGRFIIRVIGGDRCSFGEVILWWLC